MSINARRQDDADLDRARLQAEYAKQARENGGTLKQTELQEGLRPSQRLELTKRVFEQTKGETFEVEANGQTHRATVLKSVNHKTPNHHISVQRGVALDQNQKFTVTHSESTDHHYILRIETIIGDNDLTIKNTARVNPDGTVVDGFRSTDRPLNDMRDAQNMMPLVDEILETYVSQNPKGVREYVSHWSSKVKATLAGKFGLGPGRFEVDEHGNPPPKIYDEDGFHISDADYFDGNAALSGDPRDDDAFFTDSRLDPNHPKAKAKKRKMGLIPPADAEFDGFERTN